MLWWAVMKIAFVGEETLSRRTEALRRHLQQAGHETYAFTTDTTASLNPAKPGGWVWLILALLAMSRRRPDVVHLQGPKAAFLTWLAGMLHPEATYVWTIDSLPSHWIARQAAKAVDAVTTPSRSFQVRLLTETGVRAQYVPDGYEAQEVPSLTGTRLKSGQYCVTSATKARDVRWIAAAMAETHSSRMLVVMAETKGWANRLKKEFPRLTFIGKQHEAKRREILRHAALVILHNDNDTAEGVLQVMDAGRSVIATTKPLYEETLGVTAMYIAPKDTRSLAAAAHLLLKSQARRSSWGAKARRRAQHHFSWERVTEDYLLLYRHSEAQLVPLDSARPRWWNWNTRTV